MTDLTVSQLEVLALQAGYKSDMPFGVDTNISDEMRKNLVAFYEVIQVDLAETPVENIMLERFVEVAIKHCAHKDSSTLLSDMNAMLRASAMELFYTRFAYRIAAALKGN